MPANNVFEAIASGNLWFKPEGDCEPTTYLPGTPDKVEAMRQRVELGQPLFHEADAMDCTQVSAGRHAAIAKSYGTFRERKRLLAEQSS